MPKKFNETTLSKFQARYGQEIPDNHYPSNQFIEQLLARKSIRRFNNKKIDPKLIEKLLAAAQSAPTSSMLQPWSVISLSEEKRRVLYNQRNSHWLGETKANPDQLRTPTDPGNLRALKECSHFFIWLVDCSILDYVFSDPSLDKKYKDLKIQRERGSRASQELHYELRSIIDTVIAAQTFSLAAESLGLGVMYMGSVRNMDLQEEFSIPDHVMPLFGMCVGYPLSNDLNPFGAGKIDQYEKKPSHIKPRLPQELIYHQDEYKPLDVEKLHEYNSLMESFYSYYELGRDWFYRVIDRTFPLSNSFKKLAVKYGFFTE